MVVLDVSEVCVRFFLLLEEEGGLQTSALSCLHHLFSSYPSPTDQSIKIKMTRHNVSGIARGLRNAHPRWQSRNKID